MKIKKILFVLMFSILSILTFGEEKVKLLIGSAPSVKSVMEEALKEYKKIKPNTEITFTYASSGALQSQIEQGAPIDIIIAVGDKQINYLNKKNLILNETIKKLAYDELVIITNKKNQQIINIKDLLTDKTKYIAMGIAEFVPAAKTSEEVLKYLGGFENIKKKYVYCKDLLQVLSYVEKEEVEAGFVWNSIAKQSDKIKIVFTASNFMHNPVFTQVAVVSYSKNKNEAINFIKFLNSNEIQEIFIKNGFIK
ncbi:MAG: molybdate ABC transporter substrate-binding protein [Fusobacteriaceae bacterium]|nr:molybdate ABC transporter substrate-binding protein [Fusobacteriaceae bacterium]